MILSSSIFYGLTFLLGAVVWNSITKSNMLRGCTPPSSLTTRDGERKRS